MLPNTRGRAVAVVLSFLLVAVLAGCGGTGDTRQAGDASNPDAAEAQAPRPGEDAAGEPSDAPGAAEPVDTAPEFRPETATGAVPGVPAPTNTAPITAVANYFTELPGFDIAALKPKQREKFLQHVNSEMCPCGCKNDTLARCHVNDPRCPVVRGMVQKVYDEVKAGK